MVTLRCPCGEEWEATRVAHIKQKYYEHIRNCKTHNGSFFYAWKKENMSERMFEQHKKTDRIRLAFALYHDEDNGRTTEQWWAIRDAAKADFDCWFDEIKADAWDEGKEDALYGLDIHGDTSAENPYRKEPHDE